MRKLICLSASALIILSVFCCIPATAATSFTAEPVFGESDQTGTGWFDLTLNPGEHRTLTILLTNGSDQPVIAQATLANATTADEGFIDYTGAISREDFAAHALTDLARLNQNAVSVPSGSSVPLTVSVSIPEIGFDGTVLGGIKVQPQEPYTGIEHILPVSISTGNSDALPEFQLNSAFGGLMNYSACITVPVQNIRPVVARGVAVHVELFHAGRQEAFYLLEKTIDMAPNSIWNCRFPDQTGSGYPPGDYTIHMTLTAHGTVQQLEQTFTLTSDDTEFIRENVVTAFTNELSKGRQDRPFSMMRLVLLSVLVLLLILMLRNRPVPGSRMHEHDEI